MKGNYKKQMNMNTKTACGTLCKKYFQTSKEEYKEEGITIDDDEEFLGMLMPFRRNSKNKTMNNNFLSEIFASDEFCNDYKGYLDNLESVLDEDNSKKTDKFISFIQESIQKKNFKEIKNYKRIPWLAIWIEKTKEVARDLTCYGGNPEMKKRFQEKKEEQVETLNLAGEVLTKEED